LRHVKRTKILIHLVSLENEDVVDTYKTIRKELEEFDKELTEKKEIVVLTKTDLIEDKKQIEKISKKIEKLNKNVTTLTLYDDASIKTFGDLLTKELSSEK